MEAKLERVEKYTLLNRKEVNHAKVLVLVEEKTEILIIVDAN